MDEKFRIVGYDKDNDVYETICEAKDFEQACIVGQAVVYYHVHVQELRRTEGSNEPFDWFQIMKGDYVHKVLPTDPPEGL